MPRQRPFPTVPDLALLAVVIAGLALLFAIVRAEGAEQRPRPMPTNMRQPAALLVFGSQTWCQPCRDQHPVLVRLYRVGYPICYADVDKYRKLARYYGVRSVPCLIMGVDGREWDRRTGKQSEASLKAWFAEARRRSKTARPKDNTGG